MKVRVRNCECFQGVPVLLKASTWGVVRRQIPRWVEGDYLGMVQGEYLGMTKGE